MNEKEKLGNNPIDICFSSTKRISKEKLIHIILSICKNYQRAIRNEQIERDRKAMKMIAQK